MTRSSFFNAGGTSSPIKKPLELDCRLIKVLYLVHPVEDPAGFCGVILSKIAELLWPEFSENGHVCQL